MVQLIVSTMEHFCAGRGCKKKIQLGEMAVKTVTRHKNPTTPARELYYHQKCWAADRPINYRTFLPLMTHGLPLFKRHGSTLM